MFWLKTDSFFSFFCREKKLVYYKSKKDKFLDVCVVIFSATARADLWIRHIQAAVAENVATRKTTHHSVIIVVALHANGADEPAVEFVGA